MIPAPTPSRIPGMAMSPVPWFALWGRSARGSRFFGRKPPLHKSSLIAEPETPLPALEWQPELVPTIKTAVAFSPDVRALQRDMASWRSLREEAANPFQRFRLDLLIALGEAVLSWEAAHGCFPESIRLRPLQILCLPEGYQFQFWAGLTAIALLPDSRANPSGPQVNQLA